MRQAALIIDGRIPVVVKMRVECARCGHAEDETYQFAMPFAKSQPMEAGDHARSTALCPSDALGVAPKRSAKTDEADNSFSVRVRFYLSSLRYAMMSARVCASSILKSILVPGTTTLGFGSQRSTVVSSQANPEFLRAAE